MPTFAPWIRPFDAIGAMSAGAAAGARAGGLQLESQRLAQEASQHEQANQLARERMSQEQLLTQMETQARERIAQQNALRQQQEIEISKAYKDAQIGLGMAKLQEQDAIARAKAATAAKQFSDEQGFAQFMASGGKVAEGLQRFPGARPSFVNAIRLGEQKEPGQANIVTLPEAPGVKFVRQPTGHLTPLQDPNLVNVSEGPLGVTASRKGLPREQAISLLGTNAPAILGTAPTKTTSTGSAMKFRYDPKTKKFEAIKNEVPAAAVVAPTDEGDEE